MINFSALFGYTASQCKDQIENQPQEDKRESWDQKQSRKDPDFRKNKLNKKQINSEKSNSSEFQELKYNQEEFQQKQYRYNQNIYFQEIEDLNESIRMKQEEKQIKPSFVRSNENFLTDIDKQKQNKNKSLQQQDKYIFQNNLNQPLQKNPSQSINKSHLIADQQKAKKQSRYEDQEKSSIQLHRQLKQVQIQMIFDDQSQQNLQKEQDQQEKQQEKSFNQEDEPGDQIFYTHKSYIAQRIQPQIKSQQKKYPEQLQQPKQKYQDQDQQDIKPEHQDIQKSVFQSQYMQPVSNAPSFKKNVNPIKQEYIRIQQKDKQYCIKYGDKPVRFLTDKLFQQIIEHFLTNDIMLPIFTKKLIQQKQIQSQKQISKRSQKEQIFILYAKFYFNFIHKKYPKETQQFFSQDSEKNVRKKQTAYSQQQAIYYFESLIKIVKEFYPAQHQSKAKILKECLESELEFFEQVRKSWIQEREQIQNERKIQQKRKKVQQKRIYILKQIAGLELLISFQNSEMHCKKKLDQNQQLQKNIWRNRMTRVIENRNWFISHLFATCEV